MKKVLKKGLILLSVITMSFSVVACGDNNNTKKEITHEETIKKTEDDILSEETKEKMYREFMDNQTRKMSEEFSEFSRLMSNPTFDKYWAKNLLDVIDRLEKLTREGLEYDNIPTKHKKSNRLLREALSIYNRIMVEMPEKLQDSTGAGISILVEDMKEANLKMEESLEELKIENSI